MTRRTLLIAALFAITPVVVACRREPPLALRTPTPESKTSTGSQLPVPTTAPSKADPVKPDSSSKPAESKPAESKSGETTALPAKPAGGGRQGKLTSGGMGISAGIQLWSKPGGVLAGGATMTGIISENSEVEIVGTQDFMGKKHYQVRGAGENAGKEGWIEESNVQIQ